MDRLPPKNLSSCPTVSYVGMRVATSSVVEVEFWNSCHDPAAAIGYAPPKMVVKEKDLLDPNGVVKTAEVPVSSEFITEVIIARLQDDKSSNCDEMKRIIEGLSI